MPSPRGVTPASVDVVDYPIAADINRDGRTDIVGNTWNGTLSKASILLQQSTGDFVFAPPGAFGYPDDRLGHAGAFARASMADLDRDGILDLIIMCGDSGADPVTARLLILTGAGTNAV